MADVVSFGVAPSVFLYQWFLNDVNFLINSWLELGVIIASLYLVSVLLRLARFNTSNSKDFFIGLPCPLGAVLVSLSFIVSNKSGLDVTINKEIAVLVTVLISFLMISKFSYFSFKNIGDDERIKFYWLFFIIFLLVVTLINPPMVLLLLAVIYSISGPVMNLYRQFRKRKNIYSEDNKDKHA